MVSNVNIETLPKGKSKAIAILIAFVNALINIGLLYKASLQTGQDGWVELVYLFLFILLMLIIQGIFVFNAKPFRYNWIYFVMVSLLLVNFAIPNMFARLFE
jgi:hypothetical protein